MRRTKAVKAWQETWIRQANGLFTSLGATNVDEDGFDGLTFKTWTLETECGPLRVTVYEDWLACRFEDVGSAKKTLYSGPHSRLNPYSGKWNFHFEPGDDIETCLKSVRYELERVLPKTIGRDA